jgi:flagellar FliJ protein
MPRFRFNLEGVLRQRLAVEREKQRILGDRMAIVTKLSRELRDMDEHLRAATSDLRQNHLVGRINLSFLAAHRRYAIAMQRKALDQARRIAAAQLSADEARADLVEAARQRKVIEKLRERRYEQWKAEQSAKESAVLDEIGMLMGR